jgi:hypothetical protein
MHKDIEYYMRQIYQKIGLPKKELNQKPKKITNDNLIIPTINNIDLLFKHNYNLNQLKIFIKHYKLKQSGNKNEVFARIFQYLYLSHKIVPIQKIFRGYLQREFKRARGPAYQNRSLCVNQSDFLSMEEISDIPSNQFYSFEDEDGFVYGFDIVSLYNLLFGEVTMSSRIRRIAPINPYNRRPITSSIINNVRKIIRLGRILKTPVCTEIENENDEQDSPSLETRTNTLFQEIDQMGHYTDSNWFLSLSLYQLRRFVRELTEIWNYRAGITREVKREICPPLGDPFSNIQYVQLFVGEDEDNGITSRQTMVLESLEKIVMRGINEDSKALGAYYVLGALTLVNRNAALAMPWLYDSFKYN